MTNKSYQSDVVEVAPPEKPIPETIVIDDNALDEEDDVSFMFSILNFHMNINFDVTLTICFTAAVQ